jgi:hypothetical protein
MLGLYLLTGPVMEAVHSEPHNLSSACSSAVAVHSAGDAKCRIPVSPSHICVICTQLTGRLTTPVVAFQSFLIRPVSLFTVPVFRERPVSLKYYSPDKRGPPPAFV